MYRKRRWTSFTWVSGGLGLDNGCCERCTTQSIAITIGDFAIQLVNIRPSCASWSLKASISSLPPDKMVGYCLPSSISTVTSCSVDVSTIVSAGHQYTIRPQIDMPINRSREDVTQKQTWWSKLQLEEMHRQTHHSYRIALRQRKLIVQTMQTYTTDNTMLDHSHGYCCYGQDRLCKRCSTPHTAQQTLKPQKRLRRLIEYLQKLCEHANSLGLPQATDKT